MSADERLRRVGYSILSRPKHGEAVWILRVGGGQPDLIQTQSKALASLGQFEGKT